MSVRMLHGAFYSMLAREAGNSFEVTECSAIV